MKSISEFVDGASTNSKEEKERIIPGLLTVLNECEGFMIFGMFKDDGYKFGSFSAGITVEDVIPCLLGLAKNGEREAMIACEAVEEYIKNKSRE